MTRNIFDLYRLVLKHGWEITKTERREVMDLTTIEVWIAPPEPSAGGRYILLAPERNYQHEP